MWTFIVFSWKQLGIPNDITTIDKCKTNENNKPNLSESVFTIILSIILLILEVWLMKYI